MRLFEVDPMLVVTNGLEGKVSTLLFIMCVCGERRGVVIVVVVIYLWDLHLFTLLLYSFHIRLSHSPTILYVYHMFLESKTTSFLVPHHSGRPVAG